ncbi:MAG: AIM24 family protein [Bacillota bacterium]
MASGIVSSVVSGEGLVWEFEGPGKIFIQTRDTRGFLAG